MRTLPRFSGVVGVLILAAGAGAALGFVVWPPSMRVFEFLGLLLTAVLIAAFEPRPLTTEDEAAMPPSFVVVFTALLLLDPNAMTLVATAGVITQGLANGWHPQSWRHLLLNTATALASTQASGFAYLALGGSAGAFVWPWHALSIAGAVLGYCAITSALATVNAAVWGSRPFDRPQWLRMLLGGWPGYVIGASVAVALVEVIDRRMWDLLPVAAVPLYFSYRTYCTAVQRLRGEHQRSEVIESLNEGVAVLNSEGRIIQWNDALEVILGCSRDAAIGRSLVGAVPALVETQLPRAVADAVKKQAPRTLTHFGLTSSAGARVLQIKILPALDSVTVLCHDMTDRSRAEHALKRSEERFELAAQGANDGLWELDVRTQEFYVSARWRGMIGLPASSGSGQSDEWFDRVHAHDIGPLKEAIDAHLAGKSESFQYEHRIRHEDGTYRRFLCRGVAVRRAGWRSARIAGSLTDMTDGMHNRMAGVGLRDPLTGLCNRAVFVEGLGGQLRDLKERKGNRFAALYLDLDRFKVVNDSLGHMVGDELLVAVSRRLETCLRPGDKLARLGGDEFAILLNGLCDEMQANAIAFRIQDALSAPFSIGGREVFTSASIGIAFSLIDYTNPEDMMRDADAAMYHAKARGKARHELFDADMHAFALDRLGLENDLRHAVKNNDFEVHYQPIVALGSGMCIGFEALVRWTRDGKAVSPASFIPIAEELGIIEPLGTWVLQEACQTFAGWQRRFPDSKLDCITVNVSTRQLMRQDFRLIVARALEKAGLKPRDLRLEITETTLMDHPHLAAKVLKELRDFGVKIYLDDFGTGYSSLSHLHKLPVDALKIDRSFVRSLLLADRPAIVESILALARTLNTSVVAEGVESEVQARELLRLGCRQAQGYLFSPPLSAANAELLVAAHEPLGRPKVQARPRHEEAPLPGEPPRTSPVSLAAMS